MQKNVGRTIYWIIVLCCATLFVVAFVLPLWLHFTASGSGPFVPDFGLSWLGRIQRLTMQLFFPMWVFFVGACFGSFLNVVAWRVPRGDSILGPSRCPSCRTELKLFRDNLPILGWLKNGGCCASCPWPIPFRYFLSELLLGLAFVTLFLLQTVSGGMTVPFRELAGYQEIWSPQSPDLLLVLGYHLTVLSLIFTFALCALEQFQAPVKVLLVGVAILMLFQCWPLSSGVVDYRLGLQHEVAVSGQTMLLLLERPRDFLIATGVGSLAGAFCFLLFQRIGTKPLLGGFASLLLVGLTLGWQSVFSVAIIGSVVQLLTRAQFTAAVFFATLLHLLIWRWQLDWPWWPRPGCGVWQVIIAVLWIALLATVIRFANRDKSLGQP